MNSWLITQYRNVELSTEVEVEAETEEEALALGAAEIKGLPRADWSLDYDWWETPEVQLLAPTPAPKLNHPVLPGLEA